MTTAPAWWDKYTREQQIHYLKRHPRSKLLPKKTKTQQKVAQLTQHAIALPKQVAAAIDKNYKQVSSQISNMIDGVAAGLRSTVKMLPSPAKVELGKSIKDALTSDNAKAIIATVGKVMLKLGIATAAIAGGAALGIPVSFSLFLLYQHKDKLFQSFNTKAPLEELITSFTSRILASVKSRSNDPEALKNAAVKDEPDIVAPKVERASAVSQNETEIIKDLHALEAIRYKQLTHDASKQSTSWARALNSLHLLYDLEAHILRVSVMKARFGTMGLLSYVLRTETLLKSLLNIRATLQKILSDARVTNETTILCKAICSRLNIADWFPTYILDNNVPRCVLCLIVSDTKTLYIAAGDNTVDLVTSDANMTPRDMEHFPRSRSLSSLLTEVLSSDN